MLTREEVIKSINELPKEFSFDEILDRLLLLDKIEIGLEQSQSGNTMSTEEAKKQLSKWLK
jgi:predicted transcriptional regulator